MEENEQILSKILVIIKHNNIQIMDYQNTKEKRIKNVQRNNC